MKELIDYINSKVLVKIASLQIFAVLTRIIAGLLTSKAIAVFIGAEGLALIGNLKNFVSASQTTASAGLYKGVVKYVGEFKESTSDLSRVISSAFYTGFITTVIVCFFCYIKADWINDLIFPNYNDYAYVIKIFAIALPFYILNMFSFSIMNGFSKYKILIVINIIGQILSVSITLILIYQNKIDGALIAAVISESLIFLITLVGIINRRSLVPLIKASMYRFSTLKKMGFYSLMAFFSAVLLPIVAIAIRSYIIKSIGYKDAGLWEAMTRISKYYLMFISSLIGLYLLPRFSEIKSNVEFREEVLSFYKRIMPFLSIGFLLIYFLRKYIVLAVLTPEFQPVENLFLWQLLGDFVKVMAIVIAYQFLAKKMFWHYVLTEAFLIITLYSTSIYFIDLFKGIEGAVIAHFVSYIMYFGIVLLLFLSGRWFEIDSQ
ncbi:O-antigen translocase [Tamlana sp. 2_MG-2023]|uniref:O-antigen translocase n=1 Tax=unclassified Tamlana TaxID=2614803 RepID=UPI0026E19A88|nr:MULTISPECIES: O-antigen translocase [unclassified Tamlana]MDO6760193.1 O-antigen translocase [Tamlana sp. 2_MG-2023]MDO6790109.1 O-antigen translocase [Tamlana sp. 1_MG-2023]